MRTVGVASRAFDNFEQAQSIMLRMLRGSGIRFEQKWTPARRKDGFKVTGFRGVDTYGLISSINKRVKRYGYSACLYEPRSGRKSLKLHWVGGG